MDRAQQIISLLQERPNVSAGQLAEATGMGTGTLYPLLYRLEREQRIYSYWETGIPPRRRLYRLTAAGDGADGTAK